MISNFLFFLDKVYFMLIPFFEIIIIAIVIYYILMYLRGTRGAPVFMGSVLLIIVLNILTNILKFEVLSWILSWLWPFFGFAVIVIFQPEFRRILSQLGMNRFFKKLKREENINEIIDAVLNLSKKKHGALIVIEQNIGMRGIAENAVMLNAKLSHRLLEAIFWPNSPLHDGGVIISGSTILAASCIFPLSNNNELLAGSGTRHRAGLGITEETDALVIIVSEETGQISIAHKGNIKKNIGVDKLRKFLGSLVDKESTLLFKDVIDIPTDE